MLSEELLAAIYAIATEPDAFQAVSGKLAEALGYRYGLLLLRQGPSPVEVSLNQPPVVMNAYFERYFKLDPWTGLANRTRPGDVIAMPEDDRLYDTEFYVDFARPMGVVDPVGVRLPVSGDVELIVGLNQPLNSPRPTVEDGLRTQSVTHHLQRALQLREQLGGLAGERATLLAVLQQVQFGIAITAADGRLHSLNAAGEAAIARGCGLRVHRGFFGTTDMDAAVPLSLMIRNASNGGAGGALRVKAGDQGWTNVMVSPLPPQAGWPQTGAHSLVAFRTAEAPSHLDARLLMSLFGLSRVEAQVAIGMVDGLSLEEIALRRGVKQSTVKSQLDAIFEKTDTNSQRALVRLLASLPPLGTPERS